MKHKQQFKIDDTEYVYISEKLYLDKGAYSGKKRILSIKSNGRNVPFKQIDEYGRFELLATKTTKREGTK